MLGIGVSAPAYNHTKGVVSQRWADEHSKIRTKYALLTGSTATVLGAATFGALWNTPAILKKPADAVGKAMGKAVKSLGVLLARKTRFLGLAKVGKLITKNSTKAGIFGVAYATSMLLALGIRAARVKEDKANDMKEFYANNGVNI